MNVTEAVRTFLRALDRKRAVKSNILIGAYIDTLHAYGCPMSPVKGGGAKCNCGAFEQKCEIKDALEALREAVR